MPVKDRDHFALYGQPVATHWIPVAYGSDLRCRVGANHDLNEQSCRPV